MKIKSGKIRFDEWTFDSLESFGEIDRLIKNVAAEALTSALESDETYAHMPCIWAEGESPETGALEIALSIALGGYQAEDVVLSFDLREILKDDIDTCRQDCSFSEGLAMIRDGLRGLADEIDAAIKQGDSKFTTAEN